MRILSVNKIFISFLGFLFLAILSIKAQNSVVHGKVTLYQDISVQNAKITVKKTKESVYSDSLGFFTIECKIKDKLSISAAGFDNKIVKIKNLKDSININLEIAGKESDIHLAAENGHIDGNMVDFAVEQYNTEPLYSLGYTNTVELIMGKYPQVKFIDNKFIVRGINSSTLGADNGALIVINGILSDESSLKSIVVTNIKNVEIITGSSATKFGPGGGNGVISVQLY